MSKATCLGVYLLLIVLSPASAQTTYSVYYLGGQSNMDGFGFNKDLPEDLTSEQSAVMIFHGNTSADEAPVDGNGLWSRLRPGHGVGFSSDGTSNNYTDRFGVELTFAQHLQKLQPDRPIALVKYSRGGTAIDSAAAGVFGAWEPDFRGETGINQYDHFLATVGNAMASGDIDGDGHNDTLIPAGIIWMQGESDAAYEEEIAHRYEANLKRLMDLIRAAFRSNDLSVIIGRISDSGQVESGIVWKHGEIVRAAQEAYVDKDRHAALVTSTDAYGYSDPWHYNSAGYLDLGRKFAEAIHALQKP